MILWIIGIASGLFALWSFHYAMTKWTEYRVTKEAQKLIDSRNEAWKMFKV